MESIALIVDWVSSVIYDLRTKETTGDIKVVDRGANVDEICKLFTDCNLVFPSTKIRHVGQFVSEDSSPFWDDLIDPKTIKEAIQSFRDSCRWLTESVIKVSESNLKRNHFRSYLDYVQDLFTIKKNLEGLCGSVNGDYCGRVPVANLGAVLVVTSQKQFKVGAGEFGQWAIGAEVGALTSLDQGLTEDRFHVGLPDGPTNHSSKSTRQATGSSWSVSQRKRGHRC